jgi:hypothetical protein
MWRKSKSNVIVKLKIVRTGMDYSSYQLDKKDEIYHYSSKEHPKINKIAKFGCEML